MQIAFAIAQIESKYRSLASVLDERARWHWAATEALAYGWGGVSAVIDATGMSPNTIRKGLVELATREGEPHPEVSSRLRKPGGGRKRLTETDPQLSVELDRLVAPLTRGDPESPLRWTCKSTSHLSDELSRQGHPISARAVAQLGQNRFAQPLAPEAGRAQGRLEGGGRHRGKERAHGLGGARPGRDVQAAGVRQA